MTPLAKALAETAVSNPKWWRESGNEKLLAPFPNDVKCFEVTLRTAADVPWSERLPAASVAASPQALAYADFDRWLSSQSEDVQELSLLDQIELYAEQAA